MIFSYHYINANENESKIVIMIMNDGEVILIIKQMTAVGNPKSEQSYGKSESFSEDNSYDFV